MGTRLLLSDCASGRSCLKKFLYIFHKARRRHSKGRIQPRPVIYLCCCAGQYDNFPFLKGFFKLGNEQLRENQWCLRDKPCVFYGHFFPSCKCMDISIIVSRFEGSILCIGDALIFVFRRSRCVGKSSS